jgi:hypothetical protein
MKYSNEILTDNNFDKELETLCDTIGIHHNNYDNFVASLPDGYTKQIHTHGFEEWVNGKTLPNKGSDFKQAYQVGQLAYEFGNGFILLNFETLL